MEGALAGTELDEFVDVERGKGIGSVSSTNGFGLLRLTIDLNALPVSVRVVRVIVGHGVQLVTWFFFSEDESGIEAGQTRRHQHR
jgi:hypothetical protein